MLSPAFQNLKRSVVNSACYKYLAGASLHNDFVELDQMQSNTIFDELNILPQGCIMLNEDTKRVIRELGRKNMNKQQQLRKLCFFNLEALAQDAVGQNLIPADIFCIS